QNGTTAIMHMKGAPEVVEKFCNRWLGPDGEQPLDEGMRQRIHEENRYLASQGFRVLAVASRDVPKKEVVDEKLRDFTGDMLFMGLVGLMDPPRPEAREAIKLCRKAGIQVKMITGDQPETAKAVAHELGLDRRVVTGIELDKIPEDQLADEMERLDVFARVSPEHKVKIVKALKSKGHVVAMTGDGVNDAPALKGADIGVSMGITGTEVAKEASSMVLTDDNFATIVRAVKEGRGIYDNIVKFVRFQLSTNLGAIFTVLSALLLGLPEPFNPIQILWINIIMDGPPAMSLGVDPAADDVMERPPRDPVDRILKFQRLLRLVFFGIVMTVGSLGVMIHILQSGPAGAETELRAATMSFTTFVFFQFFNAFNARSETGTTFNHLFFTNRALWGSLSAVITLQVLAMNLPFLREVFHTTALSLEDWLLTIGAASSILVLEEARKLLVLVWRKLNPPPEPPPVNTEEGTFKPLRRS
ncbi:MAG: HAD-IC family P-type ATPase, partial [Deltaproteobacteria bacterium]|nr:HAD-IC family P-type ATPase [Deltaproteobacteria bacterium]